MDLTKRISKYWLWAFLGWFVATTASAQLRLASVWQSGMVVQRDQPITIWGWATPGAAVWVTFGQERRITVVKPDSSWRIQLAARAGSAVPTQLVVDTPGERLLLNDVLVGDVWLCAGQSNMAFPLASDQFAGQTLTAASRPLLRLFNQLPALTTYNPAYQPADMRHLTPEGFYQPARWQVADSVTARLFSAVGYYAGRLIQQELGVPVGLIGVAVGGSPTEAWMRPDAPGSTVRELFKGDWWTNEALEPWCIGRSHENLDALLKAGYAVPRDALGYNHPFKPGFLYQAAIEPLLPLAIRGIFWYQGESNALSKRRAEQHDVLFPELIAGWRAAWQQPNLPVYFCQLSSIGTEKGYTSENWPYFRDSQRRMALALPHVGMAITSDVGHPTDVHPTNKKVVGERLAREALIKTYGSKRLLAPAITSVRRRGRYVRVRFAATGTTLRTADGQALRGFTLGDATRPLTNVPARLGRRTVRLEIPNAHPVTHVYYGWQPFTNANLVNSEGLPLSTTKWLIP